MIEYCPKDFQQIRWFLKYNNSDILASLESSENFKKIAMLNSQSGGQSGAYVFSTYDNKFIIKTITRGEMEIFTQKMLKTYVFRVMENSNSKLVRILGVYKLISSKTYFMLMESIISQADESIIFDLKGSEHNRFVHHESDPLHPPIGKVLKDLNFRLYCRKLLLFHTQKLQLMKSLTEDVKVLKDLGIMDYSLLLTIYNDTEVPLNRYTLRDTNGVYFSIGIIDIFQSYNISKLSERTLKSIFHGAKEISSVDPGAYAVRFLASLSKIFI